MKGKHIPAGRRRVLASVLLAVICLVVGILSLLPQTAPPGGGVDLILHAGTYAGLVAFAGWAFEGMWRYVPPAVFSYSAVIEGLQTFVPGRTGSVSDLAANAVGVACGTVAVLAGRSLMQRMAASRLRG